MHWNESHDSKLGIAYTRNGCLSGKKKGGAELERGGGKQFPHLSSQEYVAEKTAQVFSEVMGIIVFQPNN